MVGLDWSAVAHWSLNDPLIFAVYFEVNHHVIGWERLVGLGPLALHNLMGQESLAFACFGGAGPMSISRAQC